MAAFFQRYDLDRVRIARRRCLGELLFISGGLTVAGDLRLGVAGEESSTEASKEQPARMPQEAKEAAQRGLVFLAKRQNGDGSFGEGLYSRNVGVCSLAGLALMGAGHTPRRGLHGDIVQRVLEFVLGCCQESGYITYPSAVSHGPMYEHGFGVQFLSEAYGMTEAPQIREKLARAVRLIVEKQNAEGGWRYFPERREADLSVTICQVTALRAAKNAGLHVPAATIQRSVEYIKRCQNVDGGFMYMLEAGGASRFPRSAAGVVALYNAGVTEGDELKRALEYLKKFRPGGNEAADAESYYFYGHYYAAQAMWQAGVECWNPWYPAIVKELVAAQRTDGSWLDTISPIYGTAMACLILQTPHNHLSIYQK